MFIVFDIGGTKMRFAGSRDLRRFGEVTTIATPGNNFDEGIRVFIDTARRIAGDEAIEAVAGGIAGPLDMGKSMLVNAPNILGWNLKPLKEELSRMLGCSVYLENDTAVVGLGEACAGAGKDAEIMVYVTVSTGIGGVRIVKGNVDANRFGFEIGHHIINMDDAVRCDACGANRGEVENYISGTAFRKKYGKAPYEIDDANVWEEAARVLAVLLNNVAVFWSPDVIVIGGAMITGTTGHVIPFDRIEHHFNHTLTIFPERPRIRKAELGDIGGMHGALSLLRQKFARSSLQDHDDTART